MTSEDEQGEPARGSSVSRWLARLVDVRPGEVVAVLWSCAYAFSVLASFYMLRPVREQAGLAYGKERLDDLFLGTLIGTLLASPVFAWLLTRFERRRLVPWVYHFFALNLVVFYAVSSSLDEEAARPVWGVFYSWLSVFNLFVVSVQWSLMADLWSHEQAKRLFAPIAVGGSLGAVAGSYLTGELARRFEPATMLLFSIVFLELAVVAVLRLVRIFRSAGDRGAASEPRTARIEDAVRGDVWSGVRLVVRSHYLSLIALYIVLQSFVQTFMYIEQAHIVDAAVTDRAGQTALFARIDFWVNVITIVVQLFLTGRIVRHLGVGTALLLQPVLSVAAFVWLGISPLLGVLVGLQVALRSIHYATARPVREMLFTVVGPDAKYKAKNLIDTFVYRGGDWVATKVSKGLRSDDSRLGYAVPFALAWIGVSALLGRRQARLARENRALDAEAAA